MRWNDGVPGDSRFLGQPAAALENRALHQLSGHYPTRPGSIRGGADARLRGRGFIRGARYRRGAIPRVKLRIQWCRPIRGVESLSAPIRRRIRRNARRCTVRSRRPMRSHPMWPKSAAAASARMRTLSHGWRAVRQWRARTSRHLPSGPCSSIASKIMRSSAKSSRAGMAGNSPSIPRHSMPRFRRWAMLVAVLLARQSPRMEPYIRRSSNTERTGRSPSSLWPRPLSFIWGAFCSPVGDRGTHPTPTAPRPPSHRRRRHRPDTLRLPGRARWRIPARRTRSECIPCPHPPRS